MSDLCDTVIDHGILGDDQHPANTYQEVNLTLLRTLIATWIIIEGHPDILETFHQATSAVTGKTLHETARQIIGEASATASTPVATALRDCLRFIESTHSCEQDEDPTESITTSIDEGPEITIELTPIRQLLSLIPTA